MVHAITRGGVRSKWLIWRQQQRSTGAEFAIYDSLVYVYRRMFPTLRVSFSGSELDQQQQQQQHLYDVYLDIIPVDNKRYRCI